MANRVARDVRSRTMRPDREPARSTNPNRFNFNSNDHTNGILVAIDFIDLKFGTGSIDSAANINLIDLNKVTRGPIINPDDLWDPPFDSVANSINIIESSSHSSADSTNLVESSSDSATANSTNLIEFSSDSAADSTNLIESSSNSPSESTSLVESSSDSAAANSTNLIEFSSDSAVDSINLIELSSDNGAASPITDLDSIKISSDKDKQAADLATDADSIDVNSKNDSPPRTTTQMVLKRDPPRT